MKKGKYHHQKVCCCKGNKCFTMFSSLLLILFLWSGQAFAACFGNVNPSTPTTDFVGYGNGIVMHTKTGLMWKQCSEGLSGVSCTTGVATTYTWQGALQAAKALNAAGGFAGYADWRVPNHKELASIMERQCDILRINSTIFPATANGSYWSSTPDVRLGSYAWFVGFSGQSGSDYIDLKSSNLYVRLVRGGQ